MRSATPAAVLKRLREYGAAPPAGNNSVLSSADTHGVAGAWHQKRVTTQLANESFKHFHVLPKYGGQLASPPASAHDINASDVRKQTKPIKQHNRVETTIPRDAQHANGMASAKLQPLGHLAARRSEAGASGSSGSSSILRCT